MALNAAGIYSDNHCACFFKIGITVPESTCLLCANTAFIFWIKINYQYFFSDMIFNIKNFPSWSFKVNDGIVSPTERRFCADPLQETTAKSDIKINLFTIKDIND